MHFTSRLSPEEKDACDGACLSEAEAKRIASRTNDHEKYRRLCRGEYDIEEA